MLCTRFSQGADDALWFRRQALEQNRLLAQGQPLAAAQGQVILPYDVLGAAYRQFRCWFMSYKMGGKRVC